MKRTKWYIALTATLLIFSISSTQAQSNFQKDLSVGISAGTTFSQVSFASSRVMQKMKMGYTAGLTLRWITENHLGLQGEINLIQQGWKENFENDPQYNYSRTINYVEVPILTHIYFGNKRIRAFVNLGPKCGYALGEKTEENLGGAKPNTENTQHDMPIEKPFDWGLCGGPGMEFRTPIGVFMLEGRYYYALSDIFNSRKGDYFSKSSSQVISAKLTYLLPLKK